MSEAFVGEIRMFAGTFAPRLWAFCDGQLIGVTQNEALFSLLGTMYGGDGRTTFGLPDMRGRLPVHYGSGPGLTPRPLGQRTGVESVVLTGSTIPNHNHTMMASANPADGLDLTGRVFAKVSDPSYDLFYQNNSADNRTNLIAGSISNTGGSLAHSNMMSSLCVSFIICTIGTYPSRN